MANSRGLALARASRREAGLAAAAGCDQPADLPTGRLSAQGRRTVPSPERQARRSPGEPRERYDAFLTTTFGVRRQSEFVARGDPAACPTDAR